MSEEELYKALKIFNREDLTYENDDFFNDFEEYMNIMKQEKAIEVFMSTEDMIKYSKLEQEIERLNNIIKEKNKDFELLRKAQLKKCQEYEDLEKLNNANYQSFIEVNNIINKAIDFLKENACIDEDVEYFCDDLRYDDCKTLLNILKGSDK